MVEPTPLVIHSPILSFSAVAHVTQQHYDLHHWSVLTALSWAYIYHRIAPSCSSFSDNALRRSMTPPGLCAVYNINLLQTAINRASTRGIASISAHPPLQPLQPPPSTNNNKNNSIARQWPASTDEAIILQDSPLMLLQNGGAQKKKIMTSVHVQ